MNKAFVREPEDTGQAHCPRCGSLGTAVSGRTLELRLVADAAERLADGGWLCPFPTCLVAYFDMFERTATVEELRNPVYPKDPAAAICPCFGFSTDEIDLDVEEGVVRRTRALVERAKTDEARCAECSPTGQSCVGEVQKYYFRRKG